MQRVTRSTAVAVQPAPPASPGSPGFFTGGNPGGGIPATIPGYEWFNAVQEELLAPIARAGLTPSAADLAQLRQAMDRLYGGGYRFVNSNVTLTADDAGLVPVDASGGSRVITLPAANAAGGRPLRLHLLRTDASANTVTVQRAGSDLIEGSVAMTLPVGGRVWLTSDGGSAWVILAGAPTESLPAGMVAHFPTAGAPSGWLKANGALLGRAAAPRLWVFAQGSGALVSEAAWFGGSSASFSVGDGATTFRLPDLRGEFLRGWDDGRGIDVGRAIGSAQAAEMAAHNHGVNDPGHAHSYARPVFLADSDRGSLGSNWSIDNTENGATFAAPTGITIQAAGGVETRPRNLALLACIKL